MTLYSVLPSFVLGFHGCGESVAIRAVAKRRHLRFSNNKYDWLGSGIYFWENSLHCIKAYFLPLEDPPVAPG